MFMLGGCALSNSAVVGVHNISERSLVQELQDRQIPIPPKPRGQEIALQALVAEPSGRRSKRQKTNARSTALQAVATAPLRTMVAVSSGIRSKRKKTKTANTALQAQETVPSDAVPEPIVHADTLYVRQLRHLLVERLQLEEEYERLTMYLRDNRFDPNVMKTKWEPGRVILDMLHCPMRMNEKVLYLLYNAAMNRFPDKTLWEPVLENMTLLIRRMGSLPPTWTHNIEAQKNKHGVELKHKLLVFHMDYDVSKCIFNYDNTAALYELIDLAVGEDNTKNLDWRFFMISYLNCLEYLTLYRDYKPGEVDELERRCNKMYTTLVTKIGGLEAVTNYFHYVGSGHVVWMCRAWGNLWRYRNEGVEAFNKIVSLRHNRHNGNGGAKRTRDGAPTELCPEFWSLGQWLGRWSMWQLGLADAMDPDRSGARAFTTPIAAVSCTGSSSEFDDDEDYSLSPGCNVSDEYSCTDASVDDACVDVFSETDDTSSVDSDAFVPLTPYGMPHMECRSLRLLPRDCARRAY